MATNPYAEALRGTIWAEPEPSFLDRIKAELAQLTEEQEEDLYVSDK